MAFKKQDTMIDINTLNSLLPQANRDLSNEFDRYCVHGDIRNPNFDGPFGYDDIGKTARHFVQWQKKRDIEKACRWLAGNVIHYIWKSNGGGIGISDNFFTDFEKAMEDE